LEINKLVNYLPIVEYKCHEKNGDVYYQVVVANKVLLMKPLPMGKEDFKECSKQKKLIFSIVYTV